jgi:hypothetical protein
MGKNTERASQAFIIGVIITAATFVLPILAWPLLIFDNLFPPDCPPDAMIYLWSDRAIVATLASELILYTLLPYFILGQRIIYFKRASYIGKV